ncbi:MAG: hypothetical protein GX796_01155 [Clostridiaceae bacterium]|nr:hypothetical protein [Clostridiaceae bacterium]
MLWKPIHDEIKFYTLREYDNVDVKCRRKDVFDVLTKNKARRNFNVVIMQYLLSHLYNTCQISDIDDLYDNLIKYVLKYRHDDSPFLIIINDIDCRYKGRDHFWPLQQKIKRAGYHGNVTAKCFKPNVYLEGAERYFSDVNKFSIPDPIKEYYNCAIRCESAQLIIEVR